MNCVQQYCVVGLSALVLAIGMAGPAQAGLIDQLDGTVLDTDLNIKWLQDANTAATNQFGLTQSASEFPAGGEIGSTGRMSWFTANDWIAAMNTNSYLGFTDWRLPTTTQPDASCGSQTATMPPQGFGVGCKGSEMGHLFNVEGVMFAAPGLFSNVQAAYWSGTEVAPDPGAAWLFFFDGGIQSALDKDINELFAWAVRSGDVSAPIPEPSTVLLLGSGLAGLIA